MNMEEIEKRIAEIAEEAGDAEWAHTREDDLYLDFIRFVADQEGPYSLMAKLLLTTQDLNFERWYA